MSLVHDIEISTDLTPKQVNDIMAAAVNPTSRDENSLRLSGLFAITGKLKGPGQSVTGEDYGFHPTLNVVFEIYSSEGEDYLGGMRAMMRATMALLQHEPGDAVMLFNGERTVLQRINGKLMLNEAWDNWVAHAQVLSEITLPYELRHLRSPALEEHAPTVA